MILILVNIASEAKDLQLDFKGKKIGEEAKVLTLRSNDLEAENSFEEPKNISPAASNVTLQALVVCKIPMR